MTEATLHDSSTPDLPTESWRFGSIEADARSGIVRVDGQPLDLDWTSTCLLMALLRAEGAAVSKDTLLQAGWPGRIVTENSLAKAVSRLRKVLGADGQALETVHGFGYRLLQAQPADEGPDAAATAPASLVAPDASPAFKATSAPHRKPSRIWRRLAALAALTALALAGLWLYPRASRDFVPRHSEPLGAIGRILWVDDNPSNNERHRAMFERKRIAVFNVTNSTDALTLLAMNDYTLVISDMGREQGREPLAGLKLLQEMRRRGDTTPFYVFTYQAPADLRQLVAEAGGNGLADDPASLYRLVLPALEPNR